jgi:hypothetical protein
MESNQKDKAKVTVYALLVPTTKKWWWLVVFRNVVFGGSTLYGTNDCSWTKLLVKSETVQCKKARVQRWEPIKLWEHESRVSTFRTLCSDLPSEWRLGGSCDSLKLFRNADFAGEISLPFPVCILNAQ